MDLEGWPPTGGAGSFDPHGGTFAISLEQISVKEVVRIVANRLDFTCTFEGNPLAYFLYAPDVKTAHIVGRILTKNVGSTLLSVAMVEIPEE